MSSSTLVTCSCAPASRISSRMAESLSAALRPAYRMSSPNAAPVGSAGRSVHSASNQSPVSTSLPPAASMAALSFCMNRSLTTPKSTPALLSFASCAVYSSTPGTPG